MVDATQLSCVITLVHMVDATQLSCVCTLVDMIDAKSKWEAQVAKMLHQRVQEAGMPL